MRPVFIMMILFFIALAMSWIIYIPILRIAKQKNLVDSPGGRKLQSAPVPVMGGLAVFFGIVVALCFFKTTVNYVNLFSTICAMMIMLYVGSIDDILDISASLKFAVEVLVCLLIIYGTRNLMINFQGLLGVWKMPLAVAIPFTVFGMVGIINSINMIDGVDGLSSGMGILAFLSFSSFLFCTHEYSYCALSIICAGALVPFFIHNVFGIKTKMYIGDGGALMIGTALAALIINILKGRALAYEGGIPEYGRLSLVSMCLAIMSVPVFDTLRVMAIRVIHGQPPFHADRRHLHHQFLSFGFSPKQTSFSILSIDLFIISIWFFSYACGASVTLQFFIVLGCSLLLIVGLARFLELHTGK